MFQQNVLLSKRVARSRGERTKNKLYVIVIYPTNSLYTFIPLFHA